MYSPPPRWNRTPAVNPAGGNGYAPATPGASQPQVSAARTVPGNQTFSPQATKPAPAPAVPAPHNPPAQNAPVVAPAPQAAHRVQPKARESTVKPQNAVNQTASNSEFISQKIWKIAGNKKFVDFNSKLTMAYINDFANVHGCGGSGHAGNSTIGIVICDYTSGTGENNSVTVKYNLDVEDVGFLYEAAMSARLGLLKPDSGINVAWIDQVQRIMDGWKAIQKSQDGTRPIPAQSLNALNNALNNARAATTAQLTTPLFSYSREKNNPYTGNNGLAPCSKVQINYTPYRKDGAPSNYPWYIVIENFDAPLVTGKNGASSHNSNQAVNKKSAFINLSSESFCNAMTAVQRFVTLWEHRTIPMMDEAYRRIEYARLEKENQKAAGYGKA